MKILLKDIGVCDNTRADEKADLSKLMLSIKKQGLLTPITVSPNFKGSNVKTKYVLVCGHRRFEAVTKLGLTSIEGTLRKVKDKKSLMLDNLAENIHRKDISPLEEGRFFNSLMIEHNMSMQEIGVRLSVSSKYVGSAIQAYESIPKKYRDKIAKSTASQRSVPLGKVPLTIANDIVSMTKNNKITKPVANKLFDMAAKKEITTNHIKELNTSYDSSKSVRDNLKLFHKKRASCSFLRMDILTNIKEFDKLTVKYGISKVEVAKKILFGEIKDKLTRP